MQAAKRILERLSRAVRDVVDGLLNVSSADPDDARRRKLLNFLLLCTVAFMFVEVWTAVAGLSSMPFWNMRVVLWSIPVILCVALAIYTINRYWSRRVAGVLLLSLLVVSAFTSSWGDVTSSHSLVSLAVPIVMASVLFPPYVTFVVGGLVSVGVVVFGAGVYGAGLDELSSAVLAFFLIALVSWVASQSEERALREILLINRDLDQRVAERTRDLEKRSVQLQTASEVARDATATLDIEKLLDGTVHLISERFGFYHAGVFLLDGEGEYATLRAASDSEGGQRMLARGHKQAVGREGIVGHVAGTGESLVVLDVGREAVHLVNPDLPETRSEVALPLVSHGRVIGVLDVQSDRQVTFTKEDVATLQTMADQLANAIEGARLFEETRRHVEELTALHNIDVAMIASLDLDEVLSVICEQVSGALDVDTFYIALCDERKGVVDARWVVEQGRRKPPFTLKVEECGGFAGWMVRNRQPLWVEDAEERDDLPAGRGIIDVPARSLIALPLIVRDQLVGIISVQSTQPYAFGKGEQQLFSDIAHQVAIAITNIRLYQEVKRRLAEAELIQEVMMAAASTLDFELVLERTAKALYRALGIDRLGFLLPNESDGTLALHPSLVGFAGSAPRIPIRGNLVGQVYRTGYPVLLSTVETLLYPDQSTDVRSALAVPVRVGDRIRAVLLAEGSQEGSFGEDEMRIFTTVAGQLGVALETARLYLEMTQYTRDLRLLAGASAGMIASLEPQAIVSHLLDALVERFHSPCCISLVDPDGESVRVAAAWMPGGKRLPISIGRPMPMSECGVFSRMVDVQQLVYVPDVEQDEWWSLLNDVEQGVMSHQSVQAGLVLPMFGQEGLVGAVTLGFHEPLPAPVDDQLDWAQALVNQAAAAVANAQLYQRLEKKTAELVQAYNELQEIDSLRAQMVQNVSHELRTPLSLIKGYVELLIEGDLGQIIESQRAALQVIRERTASLSRLIHNLMMLQAIPSEMLTLAPISLAEVVRRVLTEFHNSAKKAGVTFQEDLPEDLPLTLGDQERLELVLGHLLENAIKFSLNGGTVTLRAWADEGMVRVSIIDEGIGISPDQLGRIFERFYQVDGSAKRRFGGMGIGLALVWEIVEAHNGDVQVESEPGKGSTFTVSLPVMNEA
ncbi:MAG: GAF domain-containing protein [Anaerolineae bacterium]|nr:GAF domain-containing protein [Anaerolineae bacterium]